MNNAGDKFHAAGALITALRQRGIDIFLTPDNKIYVDSIPAELTQGMVLLLPEIHILLEREGRRQPPMVSDLANRLLPDALYSQRAELNKSAGFPLPNQSGSQPEPMVRGKVAAQAADTAIPSSIRTILLGAATYGGLGIAALSMVLALGPILLSLWILGKIMEGAQALFK